MREIKMIDFISLVIAVLIFGYLLYALIAPEKF